MTELLTLCILFSTAVRAVVVAMLLILGIPPLVSFILALREALVAKLVILVISPLTSFMLALREALVVKLVILYTSLALYASYLMTSCFTTSLSLIKSKGTGTNLSTSDLTTLIFKSLKLVF